ncbi:MAG: hypothetical protein AAF348_19735, partial [Bacteroidota bacterium]
PHQRRRRSRHCHEHANPRVCSSGASTPRSSACSRPERSGPTAVISQVYNTGKKLEGFTQKAADAVKQLVESKDLANKFQKELKELDKEQYKEQITSSKDIVKQIDSITALYLGKDDKRQGITRNPETTVMLRINTARRYVGSRKTGMTKTENNLMQFAEEELNSALEKTNTFFNTDWKVYRESIESLDVSPFKETKEFKLN